MPDLSKWIKVVTHPLGFAGFGLACISWALAEWGPDKYPWLPYLFITLAGGAFVIGVVQSFKEKPKEKKRKITRNHRKRESILSKKARAPKAPTSPMPIL